MKAINSLQVCQRRGIAFPPSDFPGKIVLRQATLAANGNELSTPGLIYPHEECAASAISTS